MTTRCEYWERLANFAARWMLIFFVSLVAWMFMQQRGQDLIAFYLAAKLTLGGQNPYDYNLTLPMIEQTIGIGGNAPFYYPLWILFPIFPLTVLPYSIVRLIWLGINFFLGAFSLWLLGSIMKWRAAPWTHDLTWLASFFLFGWLTIRNEQVAILILCDLVLTLWAIIQGRQAMAAVGLALLATKPNITGLAMAVLATWLVFANRKILWMSALTGVVLFALSFLVTPSWWNPILAGRLPNGLTIGLNGTGDDGRRLNTTTLDFLQYTIGLDERIALGIAIVIWLVALWLMWRWRHDVFFLLVLSTTLVFLISPYAMQYDFPLLTLAFFWILRSFPQAGRWTQITILAGIGCLIALIFLERIVSDGLWTPIIMTGLLVLTAPPNLHKHFFFETGI